MPQVTPEEMEQEAQSVADGIVEITLAGLDPGASIADKLGKLIGMGYGLFGDVGAGVDNDANKARFGLEVGAKVMDGLVSELVPLTEEQED
jgi:hypothetical protein